MIRCCWQLSDSLALSRFLTIIGAFLRHIRSIVTFTKLVLVDHRYMRLQFCNFVRDFAEYQVFKSLIVDKKPLNHCIFLLLSLYSFQCAIIDCSNYFQIYQMLCYIYLNQFREFVRQFISPSCLSFLQSISVFLTLLLTLYFAIMYVLFVIVMNRNITCFDLNLNRQLDDCLLVT